MADIIATGTSGYQTGAIDIATLLVNGVSPRRAEHINGCAAAIVQIETILGVGTDLKGTKVDLVERLAVEHNADGTQKTLTVIKGGTGVTTMLPGAIPYGNGQNPFGNSGQGLPYQALLSGGNGAPSWAFGMLFSGPINTGAVSTRAIETFTSATGTLFGTHFYAGNFTLNAGHTLTVGTGKRRLIICATDTITIAGTINASGAGGPGGSPGQVGVGGTDQPGGGGTVGEGSGNAGAGGPVMLHGITYQAGGAAGTASGNGTSGTQVSGADVLMLFHALTAMGGAGGGGGDSGSGAGTGGPGGGSIILIAPVIVLQATAVLNTAGVAAGNVGPFQGPGGGGGAGNIYMFTRSYTNNGATFTQNGGASSTGGGSFASGAGASGIRQICLFA